MLQFTSFFLNYVSNLLVKSLIPAECCFCISCIICYRATQVSEIFHISSCIWSIIICAVNDCFIKICTLESPVLVWKYFSADIQYTQITKSPEQKERSTEFHVKYLRILM
jgi:hypothetical protein